ncbi:MAG TPA: hypothetical protein VM779_03030 [Thermoanaerobaculia bacterium]|nr:hypothetical protein [Thermoanaerobaculia bacterium]
MKRHHILILLIAVTAALACAREEDFVEPESFSFVVYPESRYLGELTEVTRQAHKLVKPNDEPPPVAIYDTEASVEDVARFYAKEYGYATVAPDATNNLSATKPPAYFRTGDLADDIKGVQSQLPQLGLGTDVSKAQGPYKAAEIDARPNRPHVTIQRPYFNVRTSEVVDRTIILMAR